MCKAFGGGSGTVVAVTGVRYASTIYFVFVTGAENLIFIAMIIQCVQKFWADFLKLVIFGRFQNNFRQKIFQNCLAGSFFYWAILKISIFWPKIILKITKNDQISEPDQNLNAL